MHRVGYRAEKIQVFGKKSKIAHNFFVTKATYLKTIFLKSPWKMDIETCVPYSYLLKTKKNIFSFFWPFFSRFFQPSQAPKLFLLSVKFFFNDLTLANWAMQYAHAYSLRPFHRGGGRGAKNPPSLAIYIV